MVFGLPKVNNSKIMDGLWLGAGFTLGYIAVVGGIKIIDKITGGMLPDEFANARAAYSYYGGRTFNTLSPQDVDDYAIQ